MVTKESFKKRSVSGELSKTTNEEWIKEELKKIKVKKIKKEHILTFPDKSIFVVSKYEDAIKKKAKKEGIEPSQAIIIMLARTLDLWKQGKTENKFGECKLEDGMTMADSADEVFYSFLRFTILKKVGKKMGIQVISIDEVIEKVKK
jgi:hypothetical protein